MESKADKILDLIDKSNIIFKNQDEWEIFTKKLNELRI